VGSLSIKHTVVLLWERSKMEEMDGRRGGPTGLENLVKGPVISRESAGRCH